MRTSLAISGLLSASLVLACGDSGGATGDSAASTTDASTGTATTTDTAATATATEGTTGSTGTATATDTDDPTGPFDGDLGADVEVFRDARGIVHLYARSDADAMFAAGYMQASDRLFQMDVVRRRAFGRQAEVFGADKVSQDVVSRVMDFPRWGRENARRLEQERPELYAHFVAWTAGVNRRIDEVLAGEAPLPAGFGPVGLNYQPERWEVEDTFVIARLYLFGNSQDLEPEFLLSMLDALAPRTLEELQIVKPMFSAPIMPPELLPIAASTLGSIRPAKAPPATPWLSPPDAVRAVQALHDAMAHIPRGASNNWAVTADRSADGRPLLAGDPHQPLDAPSVFYGQHLDSAAAGGTLAQAGFGFAGVPGVVLGHGAKVAWTATTHFADASDIWQVTVDGDSVKIGDSMVAGSRRMETIAVRDGGAKVVDVLDVPGYGPVLPPDLFGQFNPARPGKRLLFGWVGFRPTDDEQAFFDFGTARNVDELAAAVEKATTAGFNFMAADATDVIYRVGVDVPARAPMAGRIPPNRATDGDDPLNFWTGELTAAQHPSQRNPARGFMTSANNDPWGFTADGDVTNDPWYYGSFFAAGHRAKLITEALETLTARGAVTPADMKTLQVDTHAATSDVLLPYVFAAWDQVGTDPDLAEYVGRQDIATVVDTLRAWDRRMEIDSSGAVIYHLLLRLLPEETVADEFSLLWSALLGTDVPFISKFAVLAIDGQYTGSDELLAPEGRDLSILRTLDRVATFLTGRFGSVDPAGYTWGDIHCTLFEGAISSEAFRLGCIGSAGGEDTINVSSTARRFFVDEEATPRVPDVQWESDKGAAYRMVVHFDADGTPKAELSFPPGNVEAKDSPFYSPGLDEWIDGGYSPLPFTRAEVEAAAVENFVLQRRAP
jgi:penicillin amidase